MSARYEVIHECPKCGDEVPVDYEAGPRCVTCPACGVLLTVDYDAEVDGGAWKDRTRLVVSEA